MHAGSDLFRHLLGMNLFNMPFNDLLAVAIYGTGPLAAPVAAQEGSTFYKFLVPHIKVVQAITFDMSCVMLGMLLFSWIKSKAAALAARRRTGAKWGKVQ